MRILETTNTTIKQNWSATKVVTKNIAEFVDATCLAIVSGFAIYQAHFGNLHLSKVYSDVLMFAGLVIALQAFVLLVRHFNYNK